MTAQDVIRLLDMVPLGQEGGMVKETWKSKKKDHGISEGSAIYYLLTEDSFSHLHRLTGKKCIISIWEIQWNCVNLCRMEVQSLQFLEQIFLRGRYPSMWLKGAYGRDHA